MVGIRVVWTPSLAGAEAEAYDRFVLASPFGHYAQTRAWAEVARAGRPCAPRWFLAREGDRVVGAALVLRTTFGRVPLPVAVVERGPVLAAREDAARVLEALARTTRAHGIARLAVMPYAAGEDVAAITRALAAARFRDVQTADGAHAFTVRVALADGPLFAGKEHAALRTRIRQAEKAGAIGRRGDRAEWDAHRALTADLMGAQGKRDKPRAWYDALSAVAALFVTEHAGEIVATAVVVRHGARATYFAGASAREPARFSKSVPALVAAIRWAHEEGCTTFDLGGVPAEDDRDAKRNAIAAFKLDFAKTRIPLVGAHARWM